MHLCHHLLELFTRACSRTPKRATHLPVQCSSICKCSALVFNAVSPFAVSFPLFDPLWSHKTSFFTHRGPMTKESSHFAVSPLFLTPQQFLASLTSSWSRIVIQPGNSLRKGCDSATVNKRERGCKQ